jgi:DNA-binding NarL/FixJ family response regulator
MRVLIVDDNVHFLAAASDLLERQGMTVVGTASTSIDALLLAEGLRPDVTLVDIDLGDESGLHLAQRLVGMPNGGRVILISAYPEEDLGDSLDAGSPIAFIPKAGLSYSVIVRVVAEAGGDSSPESS